MKRQSFRRATSVQLARRGQRGMTLIEIMVVVTIMALMATAVSVSVVKVMDNARENTAKTDIKSLAQALDMYYMTEGEYPNQSEGIGAAAGYLSGGKIKDDPWNTPYYYQNPGRRNSDGYDVCSSGPDKREGTEDDICNND